MTTTAARPQSPFAHIKELPADPIIGLTEAFNADPNPDKVNLGVGVYQNEAGKVPLLAAVLEAERRWQEQESTKTYLPIDGAVNYNKLVQQLVLGADAPQIAEGRAVSVQALGGTGALKVGIDFLRRSFPNAEAWISDPSWENHQALLETAGFKVNRYPYYDPQTHGLDFPGMIAGLRAIPAGSVVVLHACCHNPTGVDLSQAQWRDVADVVVGNGLIPFLDFAYQGFGDGPDQDAYAVRLFAQRDIPCLISNSFSKSFSIYRERVGGLTVLAGSADEARRLTSQLKRTVRTNYSSPPSYGAQVVATILADPQLRTQWEQELAEMRERIVQMRHLFVSTLKAKGIEQDFSFIAQQSGMFSFSGLPLATVRRLRSEYGLYIVDSGRICVAAMNTKNIDYICEAIARVGSGQ
jgi:aromatic-amino-acid transaminase